MRLDVDSCYRGWVCRERCRRISRKFVGCGYRCQDARSLIGLSEREKRRLGVSSSSACKSYPWTSDWLELPLTECVRSKFWIATQTAFS